MYYIDVKFLRMISFRLEGFVQKTSELFNFRCPYCSDSQKIKSKRRGYLYRKQQHLFFYCHNCGQSTIFSNFLKFIDPYIHKEYQLEVFSEKYNKSSTSEQDFITEQPIFNIKLDIDLPKIKQLSDEHLARKYVESRKIPKNFYNDLYYAEDFKSFVLKLLPNYNKTLIDNDPRLIIPFRDEFGKLIIFQGRTLNNSKIRYITVKLYKESIKIFGLDRVNKQEKILVVESPIDSLFLNNTIAVADANLEIGAKYFQEFTQNIVLIPDREPRNVQICKNIQKFINNGRNVCLLPDTLKGKDINEFILNGYSFDELRVIIHNNTFTGLIAKLEFDKWRKV